MDLVCMRTALAATCVAVSVLASPAHAGSTIFVNDDAPAGGNGQSWATAYRYLQDARSAAFNSNGAITSIWVAAGTYLPDRTAANPTGTGDRYAAFELITGVAIRGGFAGNEDPATFDLATRDFTANRTTLSGDLAGDDGPGFANSAENSCHLIWGATPDATTILDGFFISGGNADYPYSQLYGGGGMYCYGGSPALIHCTFSGNSAMYRGGGLYFERGSPTLLDCTFSGNRTTNHYGGRGSGACLGNGSPTLTDCSFIENTGGPSGEGSGLYITDGSPVLNGCKFIRNRFDEGGYGVGMYIAGGTPTLSHCEFIGNTAGSIGFGGGFYSHMTSSPVLSDCTFRENVVPHAGGGMFVYGGSPTLTHCEFTGNSVTDIYVYGGEDYGMGVGGGIAIDGSSGTPRLTNCRFAGNSATGYGGGIRLAGGSPVLTNCVFTGNVTSPGVGGAMSISASSPTLTNCAFTGNQAYNGAGMDSQSNSGPILTHCTFSGNAGVNGSAVHNEAESVTTLRNCIVWGNYGGTQIRRTTMVTYSCIQGGWAGAGNIDLDPRLVSAAAGDVRLGAGSPCIDAGDNASVPVGLLTDLAGVTRFFDDPAVPDCQWFPESCGAAPIVDMGAYESIAPPPTITQQPVTQFLCEGTALTFTVTASGTGALSYQWQREGIDLSDDGHYSGVTTNSLMVAFATPLDNGNYRCVITDANGTTYSAQATSLVRDATVITQQPAAAAETPATFTVVASGYGAMTYRWQKNGVELTDGGRYTGSTTPSLTIAYCACGDAAVYRCVVTGACGSVISDAVALSCQPGDFDSDTDVDQADFGALQTCLHMDLASTPGCGRADLNGDGLIKSDDVTLFVRCLSGADVAANPQCGAP